MVQYQKLRKLNFEKLIKDGENPNGFTAQTPNGTAHWNGTGWNKEWTGDFKMSQVQPDATRPEGRNNRIGE